MRPASHPAQGCHVTSVTSTPDKVPFLKSLGSDAVVVTDEARLRPDGSEVDRLLSDNSRAREWTGWTPKVGLREGLTRTSDWIREHVDPSSSRYQV